MDVYNKADTESEAVPKRYYQGVAKGQIQYVRMPAPELQKSLSRSG